MKGKFDVKKLLIRLGVLLVVVAIGAVMMVIGRGHTVYLDNKTLEYNGQEVKAYYKVVVTSKSMEKPANLLARDRGMAKCVGQSFRMDLTVTEAEGDAPKSKSVNLSLPYGMDNPIINIPALLAGLPQEAWLDEFIPTPPTEDPSDEIDIGDAFGGMGDLDEVDTSDSLPGEAGTDIMG